MAESVLEKMPALNLYPNGRFDLKPQATGTWSVSGDRITFITDGRNPLFEGFLSGSSKTSSTEVVGQYRAQEGEIILPWQGPSLSAEGRISFRRTGPPPPSPRAVATDHRSNLTRSLYSSVLTGEVNEVKKLLALGADPNARQPDYPVDKDGRSMRPLHMAVYGGNLEVAQLLLNEGANLEAREHQGLTPLHMASGGGDAKIVRLLLGRGARKDVRDDQGRTPLDLATRGGHSEIAALLRGKPSKDARP